MDFKIISASDVNPSFREYVELNFPGRVAHFFKSIEEQISEQTPCLSCQGSMRLELFGCRPKNDMRVNSDIDILMTGSPCDPFSLQRSKRWSTGDVKAHMQFDITMKSVVDLYLKWEPIKGIFEQVHGFTLPFEKGGTESPKQRQGKGQR